MKNELAINITVTPTMSIKLTESELFLLLSGEKVSSFIEVSGAEQKYVGNCKVRIEKEQP